MLPMQAQPDPSLSTHTHYGLALFRSKNFLDFNIVAISFLFNKNYLIIKLGLKDYSRDLQVNCIISAIYRQ